MGHPSLSGKFWDVWNTSHISCDHVGLPITFILLLNWVDVRSIWPWFIRNCNHIRIPGLYFVKVCSCLFSHCIYLTSTLVVQTMFRSNICCETIALNYLFQCISTLISNIHNTFAYSILHIYCFLPNFPSNMFIPSNKFIRNTRVYK